MSFDIVLQNLVQKVPGAQAALIMGHDGIPLQEFKKDGGTEIDLQTVGVEYSTFLNEFKKNATNLGVEGMEEICIRASHWTFILRLINEEYFLILALSSTGYFGKGRYLVRSASQQVRSEL